MGSIVGLLLTLLVLTLVLHVVARVLRVPVAAESYRRRPWLPTHWREPIEDGEEVCFQAEDGTELAGTFLGSLTDRCRGTIVYSHELNGDRWNALPYVEFLRSEGFDVFTFDYRRHGRNHAQCNWDMAFEVTESDIADLRAAVRVALARTSQSRRGPVPNPENLQGPEPPAKAAVIGVGKGAAVAFCAAPLEPAVRSLILDSLHPYPGDLPGSQSDSPWAAWSRWIKHVFCRRKREAIDPRSIAPSVRVPVLLIHGRNDVNVPLDSIRSFASRVGGQCQLWVVPGARHGEAIGVDTASYHRRTSRFLSQAMQARPAGERKKPSEPSRSVVPHGRISSVPAH